MSHHWSFVPIFLLLILFQISFIHSKPTNAQTTNHMIDENDDEYQQGYNALISFIKSILDERNTMSEQIVSLNQLREYLNRMCIAGFFGSRYADSCQRIVSGIHQGYVNNGDTSDETHGIQKRFFCNGFIGCKNVSG